MEIPQNPNLGISMEFPLKFHGNFHRDKTGEFPWNFHGISMEIPWEFHRIKTVEFPQKVPETNRGTFCGNSTGRNVQQWTSERVMLQSDN